MMVVSSFSTLSEFLSGENGQLMYWGCALAGSAVFALTGVMALFGFGSVSAEVGTDVDMDGVADIAHADTGFPDFKLLSVRGVFAFIMMFGWGGVIFGEGNGYSGFAGAVGCGLVTMLTVAFLVTMMLRLQQNGTRSNQTLAGLTGKVYLTIPGGSGKAGKVVVNTGDSTREVAAYADEPLETGTPVRLVKLLGSNQFKVEKI